LNPSGNLDQPPEDRVGGEARQARIDDPVLTDADDVPRETVVLFGGLGAETGLDNAGIEAEPDDEVDESLRVEAGEVVDAVEDGQVRLHVGAMLMQPPPVA
jgi:hypothetical protein